MLLCVLGFVVLRSCVVVFCPAVSTSVVLVTVIEFWRPVSCPAGCTSSRRGIS